MKLLTRRRVGPTAPENDPDAIDQVVFQAASFVLAYPDAELLDRVDLIESALTSTSAGALFGSVLEHLRQDPPSSAEDPESHLARLQAYHVQEFDLSRKHALHLSYWTDGDTRRRGNVLVDIQRVYRESRLGIDMAGELPDYLPLVLEFAAADTASGTALLQRFRASLELIRLELVADRIPHAGVLQAVCDRLPGGSPQSRAEIQARFGEVQPIEFVGLSESAKG